MMKKILAAATLAAGAFAQSSTDCNPLDTTCPADPAIGMTNYTWTPSALDGINDQLWNNTGGLNIPISDDGVANFTLAQKGNSPTLVTTGYFFHGSVSVMMKAATGTGIISAITALSDDLDEIDFEFKGGNTTFVSTNFYGKYNGTFQGGGIDYPVQFDVTQDFHNYTFTWTNDTLQWWVDSNMLRELKSSDPVCQGGNTFPQTPMRLHLDGWSGGDSPQPGTVTWAGGKTDWSKAPFTMAVKQAVINDGTSGSEYSYGDKTGAASSIQVKSGESAFAEAAADATSSSSSSATTTSGPGVIQSAADSYNGLSTGAKIGVACGVLGAVAIGAIVLAVCCYKQRKVGRRERALADAEFEKQETELLAYREANGGGKNFAMPAFGHQTYKQIM